MSETAARRIASVESALLARPVKNAISPLLRALWAAAKLGATSLRRRRESKKSGSRGRNFRPAFRARAE